MVRRWLAGAILLGACTCAASALAAAPACAVAAGESVTLRSSDFDPDVLVWDSRQRAIDYVPGSSKPRYANVALDTVGIKITTGPHKGRYGWVTSGDMRGNSPSMAATP